MPWVLITRQADAVAKAPATWPATWPRDGRATVRLLRATVVKLRVVDEHDRPLRDEFVQHETAFPGRFAEKRLDPDGRHELSAPIGRSLAVWIKPACGDRIRFDVTATTASTEVVLHCPGVPVLGVEARRFPDLSLTAEAYAQLYRKTDGGYESARQPYALWQAKAHWACPGPGLYRAIVRDPSTGVYGESAEEAAPNGLIVVMPETELASVRGQVTSTSKRDLSAASVELVRAGGLPRVIATPDRDGTFDVRGLPPGKWTVREAILNPGATVTLELVAGEGREVTLRLD